MTIKIKSSKAPVTYEDGLSYMETHVDQMIAGTAQEQIWFLEHPPIYTAGTSANMADLVDARFPVYPSKRGGQLTYHGPGQLVAYVMLDLNKRGKDVRLFVQKLEQAVIDVLGELGLKGERREGRVGIWIAQPDHADPKKREVKIAAIGVRLRKWVSFHGISINLDPDLDHFSGIVPCGISEHGVTSLAEQQIKITRPELETRIHTAIEKQFAT